MGDGKEDSAADADSAAGLERLLGSQGAQASAIERLFS